MNSNIGKIAGDIFNLIENLSKSDVEKILRAVTVLTGVNEPSHINVQAKSIHGTQVNLNNSQILSATEYFASRNPTNKMEELTVAARYREISTKERVHTKEQLQQIFSEAGRNFDSNNFITDIKNAKRRRKFFVTSASGTGTYQLSYLGQNFADKLSQKETL